VTVRACTARPAAAVLAGALASAAALAGVGEPAVPAHPAQLRFPALAFNLPEPAGLRHLLRHGVVAYVAEDHTLPLVDVTVQARIGAFLDPPGKDGLAALTASLLRHGGTRRLDAQRLDDALEALAADLTVDSGDTRSSATLNCLSAHLDEGLGLLFDMLAHPAFAADRVAAEKRRLTAAMATRNDSAAEILDRQWQWLLYGEEHVSSRYLTGRRLAALERQDLIEFHARTWQPANFVITVAGDVEPGKVLARLDSLLAAWPGGGEPVPWPPAPASHRPMAGLYSVSVPAAQAEVAIGRLGEAWDGHWSDPERYAVEVLTEVAAGNLFISRLGRRLRGREGLVYGIESTSGVGPTWPGSFQIRFTCDPAKVASALIATDEELRRLRDEPIGADELATAKSALVAGLTGGFAAPRDTVVTFAVDDLLGWPHEFWRGYRDRLQAVGAAEVRQAARRLLNPEEMVTLVVGSWPATAGEESGRLPPVRPLPLRDPLSLEALPAKPLPGAAPAPGPSSPRS